MVEWCYYDWILCTFATNFQNVGQFLCRSYKYPRGGAPSSNVLLVVHVGFRLWWEDVRICCLLGVQKQRSESEYGTKCCIGSGESCSNDTILSMDDLDDYTNWYYFAIHVFLAVQQLYVHIIKLGLLCSCNSWRVSLEFCHLYIVSDHSFLTAIFHLANFELSSAEALEVSYHTEST